jgi:hypothetical protein
MLSTSLGSLRYYRHCVPDVGTDRERSPLAGRCFAASSLRPMRLVAAGANIEGNAEREASSLARSASDRPLAAHPLAGADTLREWRRSPVM